MEISLTDLKLLLSGTASETAPPPCVGKYCIVRCRNAGVHAGIVLRADRDWVVLAPGSRRMWQWYSGFTLSEAANNGIVQKKSRIAAPLVNELTLVTSDVGEMMECSALARNSIEGAKNGGNK